MPVSCGNLQLWAELFVKRSVLFDRQNADFRLAEQLILRAINIRASYEFPTTQSEFLKTYCYYVGFCFQTYLFVNEH